MPEIDITPYRLDGSKPFKIAEAETSLDTPLYDDKDSYKSQLSALRDEIDDLQCLMYAHNQHSMLLIFQAMDAAGKDGTIASVMSGVNPHGFEVHAFKRPSEEELDHSYLWRTDHHAPARGCISIFNRSYYEEVLVVRVHPEIATKYQRVPAERIGKIDELWAQRYGHIRGREEEAYDNGTSTVKFFLNVSRDEQARRFLSRIDRTEKNWKFEAGDIKERGFWDDYQVAYEDAINATASEKAPWYVVPADDKKSMRLIVAAAIRKEMQDLHMEWPKLSEKETAELAGYREQLVAELGEA